LKTLSRFLAFTAAFFSGLTLFKPPAGRLAAMLYAPKVLAGAWSPGWIFMGVLGALGGLFSRQPSVVIAGLFGALTGVRYSLRVTRPHDLIEHSLGRGWQAHLPATQRSAMLDTRWQPEFVAPQVPWQPDIVYGIHPETGQPLLADLWYPPSQVSPTGMAVIFIHGSGWHYLDKDMGNRRLFKHLAAQGHLVMDVAHTKPPESQLEGMVADIHRAIAWLKTEGARWHINPDKIVLMGCSSGAHMALLTAYAPDHPAFKPADLEIDTRVRGVVSFSGQSDLLATYEYLVGHFSPFLDGRTPLERWVQTVIEWLLPRTRLRQNGGYVDPLQFLPSLLGGTPQQVPELYRLGSPISHVGSHCPATLLFQGAHDYTGLLPDTRRLHATLLDAGVTSIYIEFPDSEHAFEFGISPWSPPAQAAIYDTERFLAWLSVTESH